MPYIAAKMSFKLEEVQKDNLHKKLEDVISSAFSKPKSYIMTSIEDAATLYMGGNRVEKGAYISVKSLGSISKSACQTATQAICDMLSADFGVDTSKVYITYHPVDLWGHDGYMF
ncbi:MAG: hypothetical protein IKS41_05640 [Alphaproteobacteria bacterium]|nr:hypothetical protein [Alphaproteobacteria bacterium]